MSDPIILVENLGKRYRIQHQAERQPYVTLRDVIANKAKGLFREQKAENMKHIKQKSVEDFWALKDVSFEVKQGEVVGIIGRNGAGKSTLLKILSRITEPTRGRVTLWGRVASLLEVGTGFHPELTGRENIFLNGAILGMHRAEIKQKFDEIVAFAEVEKFLDTPVKRYSSGMYVRLAFAVAAHLEPEILVVDEVLAVGDAEFQRKCLGKMHDVSSKEGRTVLFVSHNMDAVQRLCGSVVLLKRGEIETMGKSRDTIYHYLNTSIEDRVVLPTGTVRTADVRQVGTEIEISVVFALPSPVKTPFLGVVVADAFGNVVFSANPRIADCVWPRTAISKGVAKLRVISPKLRDGIYSASIWFGDGYTDYVNYPDCLRFSVGGMAPEEQLSGPVEEHGSVHPECRYIVEGN